MPAALRNSSRKPEHSPVSDATLSPSSSQPSEENFIVSLQPPQQQDSGRYFDDFDSEDDSDSQEEPYTPVKTR